MMENARVPWQSGRWLNPPVEVHIDGAELVVTAAEGTDFWRTTSYGFIHDNGHALLSDLADRTAVEVAFLADYDHQFDQAGVLVRADETAWVKAGVEVSDGEHQVGAVVTRDVSDWSVAPVPEWSGREVRIRVSRTGDALTIRARAGDETWRLIRVAPVPTGGPVLAGPHCCAPLRTGLQVRFTDWQAGPADASLHP